MTSWMCRCDDIACPWSTTPFAAITRSSSNASDIRKVAAAAGTNLTIHST
jgi:hypothetical protein